MHRRHNLKHTHHRIVCSFLKLHGETRINNSFVRHELGDSKSNLSDLFHGLESLPGSFLFKGREVKLYLWSHSPTLSLGSNPEYVPSSAAVCWKHCLEWNVLAFLAASASRMTFDAEPWKQDHLSSEICHPWSCHAERLGSFLEQLILKVFLRIREALLRVWPVTREILRDRRSLPHYAKERRKQKGREGTASYLPNPAALKNLNACAYSPLRHVSELRLLPSLSKSKTFPCQGHETPFSDIFFILQGQMKFQKWNQAPCTPELLKFPSIVLLKKKKMYLVVPGVSCNIWDPRSLLWFSFLTRDQTWTPALGTWSLSRWTTREVPLL